VLQSNIREFNALSQMLANTFWCHQSEIDPHGDIHRVHLVGFGKAAAIAHGLCQRSALVATSNTLRQSYVGEGDLHLAPTSDKEGSASVVYHQGYKCYIPSVCLQDVTFGMWFCRLHSLGFRLLNQEACNRIFFLCDPAH
jgi:hypothetical protein